MFHHLATTLIINHDKSILLLLRDNKPEILNPGKWGLIGGHIENNEDPLTTAIREIKEETGLHIKPEDMESFATIKAPGRKRHIFITHGNWSNKDLSLGEGQKLSFIDLEKSKSLPMGIDQHYLILLFAEANHSKLSPNK